MKPVDIVLLMLPNGNFGRDRGEIMIRRGKGSPARLYRNSERRARLILEAMSGVLMEYQFKHTERTTLMGLADRFHRWERINGRPSAIHRHPNTPSSRILDF